LQLIKNGPDIPERLLQAHEDGRVVFFCGAGISYPAGLPGFNGLVSRLYDALSAKPNPVQQAAIKAGQFDTAIGLLESDMVVGREGVRRRIAEILTPTRLTSSATATHEALLTLSRNRTGCVRLITTNFDRLFEEVIGESAVDRYQAPLLPVPKSRWDGLVYLHGLLDSPVTRRALDRMVISSGDFGLAYLTERWAARFVSELFRNYTVCFVGYSINDPVLRYMMDALAADRLLGESPPEMFAFGSCSKGKDAEAENEWKAKNVTPILYRQHRRHAYLHRTLQVWAATYRDGVRGKERIVVESAMARPLTSTKQDDFVGRLLWALSDSGGLPAKRFAELNPVPSLGWLEPLCDERFRHADLGRFGVPPVTAVDSKLTFSLARRPAPYALAPPMTIVGAWAQSSRWDPVMNELARWLIRHLGDPALLLWLVKQGAQLHDEFVWLVERRLQEIDKTKEDGGALALARLRLHAPNAIPSEAMRTLWRLLLTGRARARGHGIDLYRWRELFNREGLTATVRLSLRAALTPCVALREPFRFSEYFDEGDEESASGQPQRIKDLVDWEIELVSAHVHTGLRDMPKDARWIAALPDLLDDFSALLRDALDLMRELGGAEDRRDSTYVHQPSISEHAQNKDFHDWTALIELTRDAWIAMAARSPDRARSIAGSWTSSPYPVFRRLAFFAAAHGDAIPPALALDWLLDDECWWLWSIETQREAMRLLVALPPRLDESMRRRLEAAILAEPPRGLLRDEIEAERRSGIIDRNVLLHLTKLKQSGVALGSDAQGRFDELSAFDLGVQLHDDQQEEFPLWMSGGWVGEDDPWTPFTAMPRSRSGVLDYLRKRPELEGRNRDDWTKRCRETFQAAAYALCKLASDEGMWPVGRWRTALKVWADPEMVDKSWRWVAPVLVDIPDAQLQELVGNVSWWLESVAKTFDGHEVHFFKLVRRVLMVSYEDRAQGDDDPVFEAINHPIGHVTEAMLRWWYRRELEDGQGLPAEIKGVFSDLCHIHVDKFKHGRVLLAAHVITLFRVDGEWSRNNLLPLFDWQRSEATARASWEAFLWSPRLYRPLMELIKAPFLEAAHHYEHLGKHAGQYASLLTFAALEPGDTFSAQELAAAIGALPAEGLHEASEMLTRALEGAADQREDYWRNRVQPLWERVWPKSADRVSSVDAEALARLCVAAGAEFPAAVALLKGWLRPVEHSDHFIRDLHESGLFTRFPEAALELLALVVSEQAMWLPAELRHCLNGVVEGRPNLVRDHRYMHLDALARKRGV